VRETKAKAEEHKKALKDFIGKEMIIGITVNDCQCHSHDA